MTLLRELIDIPEAVHHADFVISLADGIDKPKETVETYVVTEQLVECFDEALGLIASVVKSGSSKGAYLHGSFGAGKSHFMAVLNLLLQGDHHARAKPELADVVAKYDDRLRGKRFLLVPYHMVGAASMEAGVLGGYVQHVRKLHPEAPLPGVYADEALLDQARHLREVMGDDSFFANLGGSSDDDGFGALSAGWNAIRFEAAASAPPGDPERTALVGDFIDSYAQSTRVMAIAAGEGFVPFDQGLNEISKHADGLGYDGIVLFLDELILWFASRMADPDFVNQEGQKVAKLVEARSAERPAPITSLIARQRDLREFLGEGVPGAQRLNFGDSLQWWEGRFDTIELADTNLRAIVEKRLLEPRDPTAKGMIDAEFSRLATGAGRALDTLMTSDADREAFRRVYPFSPALIETLVAVSSYLQRERTALRLLLQLLVDKRDELKVGDLVPVGDLYDVIRGGEEPFSAELKSHFAKARDLYDHKIRPVLLAEYELDEESARALPPDHQFRASDRLIKTLLLAGLVPDVGPLKGLTVRRLTDLNHGTITTPIPGHEAATVLSRLRQWAPSIPELRLEGEERDPVVSLRLSGVDIQGILDQASAVDNVGARRQKIRELVAQAIDLSEADGFLPMTKTWVWRGSKRTVDVRFANVRDETDIPNSEFKADGRPRIIIDFPFDEANHGPADDLVRVQGLQAELDTTPTVAWLPSFFTEATLTKLGQLVVVDHVLAGDRLQGYTSHLSPQNRVEAKHLLENQAESLREQLRGLLRQAYGIEAPDHRWVSDELRPSEQFPTLDPTLRVRPPVAATLSQAFDHILDQVMSHRYPAHPEFESQVTTGDLRKALKHVERAVGERDHRVEVPREDRAAVRKVLGPLKIATTGEAHITLGRHWKDHFHARQAEDPGRAMTVERLKRWIDVPTRMGLEDRVANVVVCSYALMDDRVMFLAGQTIAPEVDRLEPQTELRTQELPSKEEWQAVEPMAQAVFGVQPSPILSAASVATLVERVQEEAEKYRDACRLLVDTLLRAVNRLQSEADVDRVRTATAVRDLLEAVVSAEGAAVIRTLAAAEPPTTAQAMGRSMKSAQQVDSAVEATQWEVFRHVTGLKGSWAEQGQALRTRVLEAFAADELARPLTPVLESERNLATELLAKAAGVGPVKPGPAPTPTPEPKPRVLSRQGSRERLSASEARPILDELVRRSEELEELDVRWRFRSEE